MQVVKNIEEAKKIGEVYIETETFFWLRKDKRLMKVLKELSDKQVKKILLQSDFPERYIEDIFKDTKETEALKKIEKIEKGAILSGKAGVGKTFACIYKISQLLKTHNIKNALYISLQDFDIKKEQETRRITEYQCYLIDDVNKNLNSWEKEFIKEIIYHSYNKRKKLFITTNITIKELFSFLEDEPIISRIVEMCELVEIKEKVDLRLKKI